MHSTNPSQRYVHLQNMRSHYQRLRNISPAITFQSQTINASIKHRPTRRYTIQKQLQRHTNNKILSNNIMNIYSRKSDFFNKSEEKQRKKQMQRDRCARMSVREKEVEQIGESNKLLLQKLLTVQPDVMTKEEWKKQHKVHRYHVKNIAKLKKSTSRSKAESTLLQTIENSIDAYGVMRPVMPLPSRRVKSKSYYKRSDPVELHSLKQRYCEQEDDEYIKDLKEKYLSELF